MCDGPGGPDCPPGQWSTHRFAFLFMPGRYSIDVPVGFYTTVAGLGHSPDDVAFTGSKGVYTEEGASNFTLGALENFWRSAENFRNQATFRWPGAQQGMLWAVSQAAPLRRIHVDHDLTLYEYIPPWIFAGYASGGFLANSVVGGTVHYGSQQQWFTRNCEIDATDPLGGVRGSGMPAAAVATERPCDWLLTAACLPACRPAGLPACRPAGLPACRPAGLPACRRSLARSLARMFMQVFNMVWVGTKGAPHSHCNPVWSENMEPYTVVEQTPTGVAEKPFIVADRNSAAAGKFALYVPPPTANATQGADWAIDPARLVPFEQVRACVREGISAPPYHD
eukprot:SAG22_NODE_801_length_7103_cov_18.044832_7_plen_338_part_00